MDQGQLNALPRELTEAPEPLRNTTYVETAVRRVKHG
jgi:hypothetical protein